MPASTTAAGRLSVRSPEGRALGRRTNGDVSLLRWYQDLDGPLALALCAGAFIAVGIGFTALGRALARRFGWPNAPSTVPPMIALTGTMASVLIGLVIVALWNDFRAARATVSLEATELRSTARDIELLAPSSRATLLGDLRAYADAVTTDEWPAMENGAYAQSAGRALAQLTVDLSAMRSSAFDLRERINRIGELRSMRLSQTTTGVVGVLWLALLTIPVLLLALVGLLNDEYAALHYLLAAVAASAISVAVFVALEIDLPYRGIAAVSSEPIASAIDQALDESQRRSP